MLGDHHGSRTPRAEVETYTGDQSRALARGHGVVLDRRR